MTLSDDCFHAGLLLGREIAFGVHPPQGVAHGRLGRLERALGARARLPLAGHGARASPAPARRRHAAARRRNRRRHESAGSPSTSPAVATRPAPPARSRRWAARRRTLPAWPTPPRRRRRTSPCPAPGARSRRASTGCRRCGRWPMPRAWPGLRASAVSSASTASARWSARSKPASRQQAADVLLVPGSERLHARLGADVVLAVRQAQPALQQKGDVGLLAVDARLHRQAQQAGRSVDAPVAAGRRRRGARGPAAGSAPPCPQRDRCYRAAA